MVCGNISFVRGDDSQAEEGGEEEQVMGQGEDDTPVRGGRFWNILVLLRTEFDFVTESESDFFLAKSEFWKLVLWWN